MSSRPETEGEMMTDTVANDTVQILVVEDAAEFQELLVAMLEGEGYAVARATDGETAIPLAPGLAPQVIVLDLSLPKLDGVEVCRRIRGFSDAYIVMLTGRVDEIDRVLGLEVGADDYVTKPFSARELAARVRAMLRRPRLAGDPDASIRTFGKLTIDPLPREVRIDGE